VAWYHTSVGRIRLDGQTTTEFPLPDKSSFPHGLVAGPDRNIWIAEVGGVGRLSPIDGSHTPFDLPPGASADEFGQIIAGSDGAWWFASDSLFGLRAATGLRCGEALGLKREHVALGLGRLTLARGKPGRNRIV